MMIKRIKEWFFYKKCYGKLPREAVIQVLGVDEKLADNERGLPGQWKFIASGYSRKMLTRYAMACELSKGKKVLDIGCGLGWGSYLLNAYAKRVVGIDNSEKTIKTARRLWLQSNTQFMVKDARVLFEMDKDFDVVTLMEVIEHFTKEDAEIILKECSQRLKVEGIVVGSSSFPKTRKDADNIALRNPHHPYIMTKDEMEKVAGKYFSHVDIHENRRFFVLRK